MASFSQLIQYDSLNFKILELRYIWSYGEFPYRNHPLILGCLFRKNLVCSNVLGVLSQLEDGSTENSDLLYNSLKTQNLIVPCLFPDTVPDSNVFLPFVSILLYVRPVSFIYQKLDLQFHKTLIHPAPTLPVQLSPRVDSSNSSCFIQVVKLSYLPRYLFQSLITRMCKMFINARYGKEDPMITTIRNQESASNSNTPCISLSPDVVWNSGIILQGTKTILGKKEICIKALIEASFDQDVMIITVECECLDETEKTLLFLYKALDREIERGSFHVSYKVQVPCSLCFLHLQNQNLNQPPSTSREKRPEVFDFRKKGSQLGNFAKEACLDALRHNQPTLDCSRCKGSIRIDTLIPEVAVAVAATPPITNLKSLSPINTQMNILSFKFFKPITDREKINDLSLSRQVGHYNLSKRIIVYSSTDGSPLPMSFSTQARKFLGGFTQWPPFIASFAGSFLSSDTCSSSSLASDLMAIAIHTRSGLTLRSLLQQSSLIGLESLSADEHKRILSLRLRILVDISHYLLVLMKENFPPIFHPCLSLDSILIEQQQQQSEKPVAVFDPLFLLIDPKQTTLSLVSPDTPCTLSSDIQSASAASTPLSLLLSVSPSTPMQQKDIESVFSSFTEIISSVLCLKSERSVATPPLLASFVTNQVLSLVQQLDIAAMACESKSQLTETEKTITQIGCFAEIDSKLQQLYHDVSGVQNINWEPCLFESSLSSLPLSPLEEKHRSDCGKNKKDSFCRRKKKVCHQQPLSFDVLAPLYQLYTKIFQSAPLSRSSTVSATASATDSLSSSSSSSLLTPSSASSRSQQELLHSSPNDSSMSLDSNSSFSSACVPLNDRRSNTAFLSPRFPMQGNTPNRNSILGIKSGRTFTTLESTPTAAQERKRIQLHQLSSRMNKSNWLRVRAPNQRRQMVGFLEYQAPVAIVENGKFEVTALARHGDFLWIGCENGNLRMMDVNSKLIKNSTSRSVDHAHPIRSILVCQYSNTVWTAAADGIRVWSMTLSPSPRYSG